MEIGESGLIPHGKGFLVKATGDYVEFEEDDEESEDDGDNENQTNT
jgi:hypothetical protein